jgi:ABC-type transport system involved in cytochrome bd biosynthesis fused ATPase/permease subunit
MKSQATRFDVLEAQRKRREDIRTAIIMGPIVVGTMAAIFVLTVAGWMA